MAARVAPPAEPRTENLCTLDRLHLHFLAFHAGPLQGGVPLGMGSAGGHISLILYSATWHNVPAVLSTPHMIPVH